MSDSTSTDSVSCNYVRESSLVKSSVMEVQREVFGPAPKMVFVLTYRNHPITIRCLEGVEGGAVVYVLPLRVEPCIGHTHVWPAAGELVS